RLTHGTHLGHPADDADASRHAGAIEIERDLPAHDLGLLRYLAREGAVIVPSLVEDDRQRRLQSMHKVADVGAGPLDDVLIGFQQSIELLLQWHNLLGYGGIEPARFARANSA